MLTFPSSPTGPWQLFLKATVESIRTVIPCDRIELILFFRTQALIPLREASIVKMVNWLPVRGRILFQSSPFTTCFDFGAHSLILNRKMKSAAGHRPVDSQSGFGWALIFLFHREKDWKGWKDKKLLNSTTELISEQLEAIEQSFERKPLKSHQL